MIVSNKSRTVMLWGLLTTGSIFAAEKADIVVAKDGSGKFTTIQEAINSIPSSNSRNVTILVKNGTYAEHIAVDKSFISIIGESREKTIIEFSILRTEWQSSHSSSAGCAVINIGCTPSFSKTSSAVTDVVIGNLTVQNTYNTTGDKTMVIKDEGNSNRIFVVNCNVWCKGHDTISLWSSQTGMYYHADCSFRGSVDAVCPRGWCYAVNCEFYEVTSSAPLWHEAATATQKFVVRCGKMLPAAGSTSNFKLLNANNSSSVGTRFFLLDCLISGKCNTSGTYTEAYFYNCHGETSDQAWYKNNLSSASGSPSQSQITAQWTFDKKWDPENTMPAALPFSALPQPWNGAYGVAANVQLKWIGGRNADWHAVYFGTANPPSFVKTQAEKTYSPANLAKGTYYWRVDAIGGTDTVQGAVWSFTVDQGVSIADKGNTAPTGAGFSITQNKGTLNIHYKLEKDENARIGLFTAQGREMACFPLAGKSAGAHTESVHFEKTGLPKGRCLASLRAGSSHKTAVIGFDNGTR
jgi:pectinesterase